MALNPRTPSLTRRTAFGLAAAAFIGTSALGLLSARAQQVPPTPVSNASDQITAETDCNKYRPGELMADTECEILKGRIIAKQNACIAELVKFKKAEPDKFKDMSFGTITRDNACKFASRIPKRAASLQ